MSSLNIRMTRLTDAQRMSAYFLANREHFRLWEPDRLDNHYQQREVAKRLQEYVAKQEAGLAAYFIGMDANQQVVAHCYLTNIIYGPFQSCYMGYGVAREHEGKGIMTQVCRVAIEHAFDVLGLNRVMANYMPSNQRSAVLLRKLGFEKEGLARRYLHINGSWEDHVLTSLLNPANAD